MLPEHQHVDREGQGYGARGGGNGPEKGPPPGGEGERRDDDGELRGEHAVEKPSAAPVVAFGGKVAGAHLQLEKLRDRLVEAGLDIVALGMKTEARDGELTHERLACQLCFPDSDEVAHRFQLRVERSGVRIVFAQCAVENRAGGRYNEPRDLFVRTRRVDGGKSGGNRFRKSWGRCGPWQSAGGERGNGKLSGGGIHGPRGGTAQHAT